MPTEIWSGGRQEYYGSGVVPKTSDTPRMLLVKRLRSLISLNGAVSANREPMSGDTQRILRNKILSVLDGT